jgi:hypothetical protein
VIHGRRLHDIDNAKRLVPAGCALPFPVGAAPARKGGRRHDDARRRDVSKAMVVFAALSLAGCAVNAHQNGRCQTPGVSPFASNCPTADELKRN